MRLDRMKATVVILGSLALGLAVTTAYTVPRYSTRYGQDCNLCHMNPSGGGQRSAYATQFIVPNEMAMTRLSDEEMEAISPQVSESITIGADLRTLFLNNNLEKPFAVRRTPTENFFEMQGNLYLSIQMTNRFSVHMSKGLSSTYEVYGLGYFLPLDGYVKVGRFVPTYGWRFADHTAFVRDFMGFFPPSHTDVGMEAGISPGAWSLQASVLNGQLGSIQDFDNRVAVAGRGAYRFFLGETAILSLGASAWRSESDPGERVVAGPFGSLHLGRFDWVGEADFATFDSTGAGSAKSWFTSHQLTANLTQGLDLKGTFDLYDPDRDADTGLQIRYGAGVEVMPYPFVRVEGMLQFYRNQEGDGGIAISDPEYTQVIGQVHFFY